MQSGALFGRYRLDRSLSVDENGEVWAAFDTVTARHVAVRALPRDASEDDEYCDRFVRDAGIAAHIRNPHVVPIHDFGQIGNRLYLATPLIGGTNLRTILQSGGPMEASRAVGVVQQVAAALEAVHAAGLVERGVASANVVVLDGGLVQLTDVGLPTAPGAVAGVPGLSTVLYECLTGGQFASNGRELPSSKFSTLPVGMQAVIARGTAADPARRYRSPSDLAAAAARAAAPGPQPAADPTPAIPPNDRNRRLLLAGLALAAVIVVAIVGGVIIGSQSASPDVVVPVPASSAAGPPPAPSPTARANPTAAEQVPPTAEAPVQDEVPPAATPAPQSPQVLPAPVPAPAPAPQVLPCYPGYEHTPPPDGPCLPPGSPPVPAPVPAPAPAPAPAPQVLPCYPGYEHTPPPDGPCWAPGG
ncbi:protein kinase [Rhodococcus sp. T2V]|uniref:protein kinase n=1 Tax=Rhodococcus sp. T2V TaxID=3034164 RepID=UPI0023E19166|nr:protein kinase [Rhodococcus sp. T2V]MDF3313136.1 protein kinase [Rhodococcus sp. T2V]